MVDSANGANSNFEPLGVAFIRHCKNRKKGSKVADTMGRDLTGGRLLAGALIARKLLINHVLEDNEQHVGVLLPPSVGGVVVNMALALDRRVSVNLNYTVSADVMNSCIEQAEIKHIITSKRFMEKVPLEGLTAELVYLEDLMAKVGKVEKLAAAWQAFVTSPEKLARKLELDKVSPDDVATIIFTSGSTGQPKGVMLTQHNVLSNVQAVDQIIRLTPADVVIGVLPFFHSFGYTITLWLVCGLDIKGAYHFSPLEPRQVGKMCETHGGTILLATPTFLRGYLKRCTPEQLKTVDVVVTGAEKLPKDLADAFEKKFGVRPVEGYGATELSPLASVNVPHSRSVTDEPDAREGTVGRPVPNVYARVLDLDTGEECATGDSGMLWIKGPNVMKGYLKRDDLTAEAIKDGWYLTGDVGRVDEDGFIQITGRVSRFSKIGGEMVPHILIEETLATLIGDDEQLRAAVTAVPDQRKGERLVVLHTELPKTVAELREGLAAAGLPNIYIPTEDSFRQVDELPVLGTGKLDLKRIKQMGDECFSK